MKKRASLIDDLSTKESTQKGSDGYPILFSNPEIRRMLRLANAGPNDVFFDLGCGWGQNLKIALTEFGVKRAIGFEIRNKRAAKARSRLRALGLSKARWKITEHPYEGLYEGPVEGVKLEDATIVFLSILSDEDFIDELSKHVNEGCRLLFYYSALIPEVMPNDKDYPFYVCTAPFQRTKTEHAWLKEVVFWRESSLYQNRTPDTPELWDELRHDARMDSDLTFLIQYKKRLRNLSRRVKSRSK